MAFRVCRVLCVFGVSALVAAGCSEEGGDQQLDTKVALGANGTGSDGLPTGAAPAPPGAGTQAAIEGEIIAVPEPGESTGGPIRCCLPGEGWDCCTDQPAGTCFAHGDGLLRNGHCVEAGDEIGGKTVCPASCCEGLARINKYLKPSVDGCQELGPLGIGVCVPCGDGICGEFENSCNCPSDCPP